MELPGVHLTELNINPLQFAVIKTNHIFEVKTQDNEDKQN